MKGKIIIGRGLAGLARYVNKKDAEHIDGSCHLRPDVRQAAVHISISMPPGQPLTPAKWQQAGDILRAEMGLQDSEFQLIRHSDTPNDHAHLVACKIRPDGSIWNDSHSARRLHRACEKIEKEMGLQLTLSVEQHRQLRKEGKARKPITDGALRHFQRTGAPHQKTKEAIQRRIANERKNAGATAHSQPVGGDVGLARGKASDRPKNQGAGSSNPAAGKEAGSAGSQTQRHFEPVQITGQLEAFPTPTGQQRAPRPAPTLNGRLSAHPSDKGWTDLHWQNRDRPTFRWTPATQRISLLARPDEQNVKALFDAAHEAGLCTPALMIYGTDEFKMMAAAEAARRGILVDDKDEIVKKHYQAEIDRITSSHTTKIDAVLRAQQQRDHAAEQERQQREQERIKTEIDRLENLENEDRNGDGDDRSQQHLRMEP